MRSPLGRREAIRHLVVMTASVAVPGLLLGCSKKQSCSDVTGLTPDEVQFRNNVAAYVEVAPDPTKKCDGCAQWTAAPAPGACGGCKVVKGPINAAGGCKLFVARPS